MPPRQPPADPAKFAEAISAWRQRVPMTKDEFDKLDAVEREHAFTVANVAQADLVQQVFEAIDRAIEHGTPLADFKTDVAEGLADAWGGENPARVETIFRTGVMSAYNAGRHAIMDAPVVKAARPYWQFHAVLDARTSDICDELDGTVLSADDEFWDEHTPPLHPNCFGPGVLVTTSRGLVPIESVRVGDRVLTHRGRLRAVTGLFRSPSPQRLLNVRLDGGRELRRGTTNHPALTNRGWVELAALRPGDRLFEHVESARENVLVRDGEHQDSVFEECLNAACRNTGANLCDLDGEPTRRQEEVGEVERLVENERALEDELAPAHAQPLSEGCLGARGSRGGLGVRPGIGLVIGDASGDSARDNLGTQQPSALLALDGARGDAGMRGFGLPERPVLASRVDAAHGLAELGAGGGATLGVAFPLQGHGLRAIPKRDAVFAERASDDGRGGVTEHLCHGASRHFPGDVQVAEVSLQPVASAVSSQEPSLVLSEAGHLRPEFRSAVVASVEYVDSVASEVFNIEVDEDESYVADGVVVHNCRSILVPLTNEEADDEGVDPDPEPESEPAEGFGAAPTEDGVDWEPDLSGYAPEIAATLRDRLSGAG